MSDCDSSCQTLAPVQFFVDVEIQSQSQTRRFGPVATQSAGDTLLIALASRSDVTQATLVKEAV